MTKKIKILHIQQSISFGGVERRRLSLAKHLEKDIFEQKIICTDARGPILEGLVKEGIEVISIGKFTSPFHWKQHRKVQQIIEEYQPDIIHGAVFEGVTMAAVNGWLKKVPTIIIEETSDPQNRSWKGNLLMKLFSFMAHKVIGVSEGVTQDYLIGKLGISSFKSISINNGVVIPRTVNTKEILEVKNKWGINDNDFVIGSTGRMLMDSHKRFSDLIKAFAIFSKEKTNAKLLLVGDGPEREGYEKLAEQLGIQDNVLFTGYQSDVTQMYQLMDVFCLVSAREAFGLVLAEAMLNKVPVLATRVGGMKYIVDDKETGFLVDPFQTDQISEKMEVLYQNELLRKKMGEKGYQKAMTEYTEEIYVQKVSKLYQSLIK